MHWYIIDLFISILISELIRRSASISSKKYGSASKTTTHIRPRPLTTTVGTLKCAKLLSKTPVKHNENYTKIKKFRSALIFSPLKLLTQTPSQLSLNMSTSTTTSDVHGSHSPLRCTGIENWSARSLKIAKSQDGSMVRRGLSDSHTRVRKLYA